VLKIITICGLNSSQLLEHKTLVFYYYKAREIFPLFFLIGVWWHCIRSLHTCSWKKTEQNNVSVTGFFWQITV